MPCAQRGEHVYGLWDGFIDAESKMVTYKYALLDLNATHQRPWVEATV